MTLQELITFFNSPVITLLVVPFMIWLGKTLKDIVLKLDSRITLLEGEFKQLRQDFRDHDVEEVRDRQERLDEQKRHGEMLSRLVGLLEAHYNDFRILVFNSTRRDTDKNP
ncbi:hypothetical protein DF3PA_70139 [Candidatus Defluviicoccus seviourii]|uniref:Uncharacterized protein n=1 Tax=Candidatus Defluviicoccus seviourii TaxID=2565273 RepID=A0A564WIN8_9PROT|nr:hypothetical protein DF3PA_70139 [Candidatus Defluviicoccus seviourii]